MSLDIFKLDQDVEQQVEKDTVGGFAPWETDLYKATIKAAFLDSFASGSKYIDLTLELVNEQGDTRQYNERVTVWSDKTKGPYYIDKKTGKKKALIGLNQMNSLGELLCGKKLQDSVFETKVHKVYSADAKAQVPQEKATLVEWTGKTIHVGLQKVISNKQVKSGNDYVDSAEKREDNQVDKYFDEDKKTLLELQNNKPAEFYQDWVKANKGRDRNKYKAPKGGAVSGVPSATAAPLKFE